MLLTENDFEPYQHWMADRAYEQPYTFLAAEMGLGKTPATLYAVRRLLDEGVCKRALVVAPLYVAENTWPDEIAKWRFSRPLTYSVLTGSEAEREAARLQETDIHIINRENLVWLWSRFGADKWPYDLLVYDEASRLKGGGAKTKPAQRKDGTFSSPRLSEFGALALARNKFDRVIELSGTPAPNGLIDLWGPFYILDRGNRLGRTKTAFKQRWFSENRWTHEIKPHDHSFGEITDKISDVMVSLREADYLSLPPLHVSDRYVNLPKSLREQYHRFEKDMVLEEYDVEAVNSGVLTNKLLQFANGSLYLSDDSALPLHDLKLQALESIVEEAAGKSLLVAYSFKFDLERIKKRYPKARVFGDSKNDMRDWTAGRIPMLICHPASAGHGLNFQFGGHIGVWYGLTWSLELYQQFNKRLHRRGQENDHVMLYRILAKGTADIDVGRALERKGATQDAITNTVRVRLEDAKVEL